MAIGVPDISLVVTFHREGYIAGWTLDNLECLRRQADVGGLAHELICVLDKADDETTSVVENHGGLRRHDKIVPVANGDPAMSRNDGVSQAGGAFVATFDGDDYYSRNWLTKAHQVMASGPSERVVHPEFVVSFGAGHHLQRILDQEKHVVPREALLLLNPWGSSVLVARSAIASCPYESTRAEETGFGFEDWHWNLQMLTRGFKFVTAPGTARYYRRRAGSVLSREISANAIMRPGAFFRPGSSAASAT